MVEETHTRKRHCNAEFVASVDDEVVTHRAARFRNVRNTALVCAHDVVVEGEERVGGKGYAFDCVEVCAFLFTGK